MPPYIAGAWTLAGSVIFSALVMGAVYGPESLLSFTIPAMGSFVGACMVTYSFRR